MTWPRAIAHVDLDAFFASVEQLDHPELRGRPVLVGGRGRRAVVAAASYEARRFGCHSAQPMSQALQRCPDAVVCPPQGPRYAELSQIFFETLSRFSPLVESLSIDEGFVDLSGTDRLLGDIQEQPQSIMQAVFQATQLHCSVGLASNKFLAKMASEVNKPNGFCIIEPGKARAFLDPLPVSRLWGVGKKTQQQLHKLGLYRIGDIAALSQAELADQLGSLGLHLHALSQGQDHRAVQVSSERKQIGIERTFEQDLREAQEVQQKLLRYASELADRLVHKGLRASRVQLKLRSPDFRTITRQQTLPLPSFDAGTLYRAGWAEYLRSGWMGRPLRLLGLSVSQFTDQARAEPKNEQLSLLLGDSQDKEPDSAQEQDLAQREDRQRLVSQIRERFGNQSLFLGDTKPDSDT